jgi:hypothetical protein
MAVVVMTLSRLLNAPRLQLFLICNHQKKVPPFRYAGLLKHGFPLVSHKKKTPFTTRNSKQQLVYDIIVYLFLSSPTSLLSSLVPTSNASQFGDYVFGARGRERRRNHEKWPRSLS